MSYVSAEHDRMLAAMILPCVVVAVDLAAARYGCAPATGPAAGCAGTPWQPARFATGVRRA